MNLFYRKTNYITMILTFSYNPWVCLFSSALCVAIMFWMSWLYAAITIGVLVVLGLYVFWANPEANWGSSTQGQVFVSALKHVKEVTGISILNNSTEQVNCIKTRLRLNLFTVLIYFRNPRAY